MANTNENPTLSFWQQQQSNSQGMMLNDKATELDKLEQKEIISYLPNLKGKKILELGAGIGRYTKHFATLAQGVTVVDFVEKFIEKNKINNAEVLNITYFCSNVMDIEFPSQSFDFIFVNWLFMYLEDKDIELLIPRIHTYLQPKGTLFLRESCFSSSNPNSPHTNSHYREPNFYEILLLEKFDLLLKGNIKVYEFFFNNPNQFFWLLQKK
jgi:phosphoethanolamine N-methyltransferase